MFFSFLVLHSGYLSYLLAASGAAESAAKPEACPCITLFENFMTWYQNKYYLR